jgi:DNA-binding PadR family transcriptional regulator
MRTTTLGFVLHNNSLYPALRRFEEAGAVTKTAEPQEGRPSRLVYTHYRAMRELAAARGERWGALATAELIRRHEQELAWLAELGAQDDPPGALALPAVRNTALQRT